MENHSFQIVNEATSHGVPAVAKTARVLREVADAMEPLGVSEIARRAGLSKSTAHGLVTALVAERFLEPRGDARAYALGPRLVALGVQARDQRLVEAAQSALDEVSRRTGETVLFGCLHDLHVTILGARQGTRAVHLSAVTGSSVPVLAGALGKAYLALLEPDEAARFLSRHALPTHTERSELDPDRYLDQVAKARTRGFATERGEYLPGIAAVARALSWLGGTYFLWIVGIEAESDDLALERAGRELRAAVERLRE